MLGTRGARLGIIAPEIYDVQVEAIVAAARNVHDRLGESPHVEIMLPLVAYEQEVEILRGRVEQVVADMDAGDLAPLIGTMIELPRACFIADRIARGADFFSFGTNDLTQTALGFSRDDVESGFLSHYLEARIIDRSPFETIDRLGVGWLVRLAAWVGREARPDLRLGIWASTAATPTRSPSSTWPGSTTSAAPRPAFRSPAWPPHRTPSGSAGELGAFVAEDAARLTLAGHAGRG
jgi:pyruvate,orthophosphate dikinase